MKETEIIVCPKCIGKGTEEKRSSAYDTETITCDFCDGFKVITKITEYKSLKK